MPAPFHARSLPATPRQRLGFSRVILLVFWCFVLWGTWLGLGLLWMVVSQSPRAAWTSLTSLSPVNIGLVAVAPLVWLAVVASSMLGEPPEA